MHVDAFLCNSTLSLKVLRALKLLTLAKDGSSVKLNIS